MKTKLAWTYKGVCVFPSDMNSSGIRWYARSWPGSQIEHTLRADTKEGMKELIRAAYGKP